jgi:hypothetical protein
MTKAGSVSNVGKNMRKLYTAMLLGWTLVVPSVFALNYTVTTEGGLGYGPYQTGAGGEFTLQISTASAISSYIAGKTSGLVSGAANFQTFCVETSEYIYPSTSYNAVVNPNGVTVYGNSHLTEGAAYLYSQFAQGTLAGYSYGTGRTTTAGQLQNAIWAFMGLDSQVTTANNTFYAAAATALGGLTAAQTTAAVGYDGVYVLNLYTIGTGTAAQDQLIYTGGSTPNNGVPDGGMTVMLLGMALTSLGFFSRRLRH